MKERMLRAQKKAEAIEKMLNDDHISCEVWADPNIPVVCVEIHWGDWKHDHLRADWLVREAFAPSLVTTEVTEEDGSDCYSAIHRYLF